MLIWKKNIANRWIEASRASILLLSILLLLFSFLPVPYREMDLHEPAKSNGILLTDTRSTSAPEYELSESWSFSYDEEDVNGTSYEGSQTLMVEAVQDINLGGFEYESYRISFTGDEEFTSPDYTGSTDYSGNLFLRTADLALIKIEKTSSSQIDGVQTTRTREILETYQPPLMDFKFPLEKDKSWTLATHHFRQMIETIDQGDPKTTIDEEDLSFRYWVKAEENVTVDAGEFFTYSVRRSEQDNMQNYTQYWYSPLTKYMVKEEKWRSEGGPGPVKWGESELIEWAWNRPPELVDPLDDLSMEEDVADSSVDLNDAFSDPDDDPLIFGFEGGAHLSVSLDSGKVTLTPPDDWSGDDTIIFSASDGKSDLNATATLNITVTPVDDPPVLKEGAVSPITGTADTEFTFSVHFLDIEGDEPTAASAFIDGNGFTLDIPSGVDWIKGGVLEYSTTLSPGNHEYYFSAEDGTRSVRFPASGALQGPVVDTDEHPPILSDPLVKPDEGEGTTEFTFEVHYQDADDDPAEFCVVYIDNISYSMNPGTGSWSSGKRFTFTGLLTVGEHSYYFHCSDGKTESRLPSIGMYQGLMVTKKENHAPELGSWDRDPWTGDTDTLFTFSIEYIDIDGDKPEISRLVIDGEEYEMIESHGNVLTGMEYYYSTILDAGKHTFLFIFSDGIETVRSPVNEDGWLTVAEGPEGDNTSNSGSDTEIQTYILVIIGIISILIILYLVLRRGKRGQHRPMEVEPMESMEWE